MKSFATIIAIISTVASTTIAYDDCSTSVLTSLLTDSNIDQCSSDSGYVFTAASIPDQATIDLMCASTACQDLLADVEAMGLSECIIPVGDDILLFADLVDYVPANCPSSDSGSSTTSGSASATDAPASTTATPTTTTATPTATTATSSGSSSATAC